MDNINHSPEEKRVRRLQAKLERERQMTLKLGLKHLLASRDGRFWLWELLASCKVGGQPHSFDSTHATSFACGELNVGNRLLAQLTEHFPEAYLLMMQESIEAKELTQRRVDGLSADDSANEAN